jgi:hypothetical protein
MIEFNITINIWAGEIPIEEIRKTPVSDLQLSDAVKLPEYFKYINDGKE